MGVTGNNNQGLPVSASGASQQILIVEDERIIAYDLQVRLRAMGYGVVDMVSNSDDAIRAMEKGLVDLVLMDVVIEGPLDGIQTAEEIRKRWDVPIIFITAFADEATFQRASNTDPFAYLIKPFQERELGITIRTALQKYELEKRLKESELRYRSVFEETYEPILILDNEGCVKDANQAALNIFGWDSSTDKDFFQLFSEEGQDIIHKKWQRFLEIGTEKGRLKIYDQHNQVQFIEYRLQANIMPKLHMAVMANATHRIESQMKIEELARMASDSPQPVIRISTEGEILYFNNAALPFITHWSKRYRGKLPLRLREYIELGNGNVLKSRRINYRLSDKTYAVRLAYVEENNYFNFYATDITSLKRTQKLLTSQRDGLELIARGASMGTVVRYLMEQLSQFAPDCVASLLLKSESGNDFLPFPPQTNDSSLAKALHLKLLEDKNGSAYNPIDIAIQGKKPVVIENEEGMAWFKAVSRPEWKVNEAKLISIQPLISQKNQVLGVLVFVRQEERDDLTDGLLKTGASVLAVALERNQTMKTVQKQAQLFGNISDGVAFFDELGYISDWNQAAEKIFDIKKEQILGKRLADIEMLDEDNSLNRFLNLVTSGKESKNLFRTEIPYYKQDVMGTVEATVLVVRTTNNKIASLFCVFRDISEKRNYQTQVEQSQANLMGVIENTEDIILSLDPELNIKVANQNYFKFTQRVTGERKESFHGFISALKPETQQQVSEMLIRGLNGEKFQREYGGSDGTQLEININPMYDVNRKFSGISIVIRDITQRKRSELELKQTNFELDSFVYRASHDLRAPLRSVLGLLKLIEISSQASERENYLRLIEKTVNKLDNFITDLTTYSRNSRMRLISEVIDFNKVIDESAENLRYMASADRVSLSVDVIGNKEFRSDPNRLGIVFQNLLSNAVKYQDFNKDHAFVKIRVACGEHSAHIHYQDNGRGIADEFISKIFEMFTRAADDSYGSGLGLYITRQVVDKLGGKISVTSQLGLGTQFSIVIPNLPEPEEVIEDDEQSNDLGDFVLKG